MRHYKGDKNNKMNKENIIYSPLEGSDINSLMEVNMSTGKLHDKDEEEEEPDDWNSSKKSSQMKRRSASSSDMSCRVSTPGTT